VLPLTFNVPSKYELDPLSIKKPVLVNEVLVPVPIANTVSAVLALFPSCALNLPKNALPAPIPGVQPLVVVSNQLLLVMPNSCPITIVDNIDDPLPFNERFAIVSVPNV